MKLNNNIYNLRKTKGFSQESIAKEINVSRQTISNWELGETAPNPEQLLLLSKVLEISVDELLGNEMNYNKSKDKYNSIYLGAIIICGSIVAIWSFAENRFRTSEIMLIIIGGLAIGFGIGLLINGVIQKIECKKKTTNKQDSKF